MRSSLATPVLHLVLRGQFDAAKQTLLNVHEQVQRYTGPWDLPEPPEELCGAMEALVEREARNVPTR